MRRNMQLGYGSTLSAAERQTRATELDRKFVKQQNVFGQAKVAQKAAIHASFEIAYNIAKHSNSLCDGEFVKKCMFNVADRVCPEQRKKFEEVSLSRRTVARRIEAIGEDLTSQLKGRVPSFQLFSLALNERTDIDDTAQLLIFVRGISLQLGAPSVTGDTALLGPMAMRLIDPLGPVRYDRYKFELFTP